MGSSVFLSLCDHACARILDGVHSHVRCRLCRSRAYERSNEIQSRFYLVYVALLAKQVQGLDHLQGNLHERQNFTNAGRHEKGL